MAISDMSLERSGSEPSTSKALSCVMLFVDWLCGVSKQILLVSFLPSEKRCW
jgi:hypothetical protein